MFALLHRAPTLLRLAVLLGVALWTAGCTPPFIMPPGTVGSFVNPLYEGADPWVVRGDDGLYYLAQSEGRSIAVWKSERLTDRGSRRVVWRAPSSGWNTSNVWAPELHRLGDRWYIYYAADSGENEDHRMGVLESVTGDPQGAYVDRGMLYTGDEIETGTDNRWAIDGTPFEYGGKLYFIWSGWETTVDEQWLYIAEMENPWTVKTNRVRIADNDDYLWERVSEQYTERGLNEAPQLLRRADRVFLIYSASGSWQPTYKLGLLTLEPGADPMVPASWTKSPVPVFAPTEAVFGVGHASFTTSPDGREPWMLFHAKVDRSPGWRRVVHLQPFSWKPDGSPDLGSPVPPGVPLRAPSGE